MAVTFCRHRDEPKVPDSGASTDEENEDGDFTVYECPGLAPVSPTESVLQAASDLLCWTVFLPSSVLTPTICVSSDWGDGGEEPPL